MLVKHISEGHHTKLQKNRLDLNQYKRQFYDCFDLMIELLSVCVIGNHVKYLISRGISYAKTAISFSYKEYNN